MILSCKKHVNLKFLQLNRGVSEWLKVQSWKGCVGAIPPWVRIPSPLYKKRTDFCLVRFLFVDEGEKMQFGGLRE